MTEVTTSSGPASARPRPTSGPRILLALILLIACPAGVFLIAASLEYRSPLVMVAACLLLLPLLAAALVGGLGWIRPSRTSQLVDWLPLLCVLAGAALCLGIVLLVAGAYGIRGSALPRVMQGVRHDIPLPLDLGYLAAVGLALLTLAATAATGALLVLHASATRQTLGRAKDGMLDAAHRLADPSPDPISGEVPGKTPKPPATGASDGFLRRNLPPVARVLMVAGAAVSLGCVLVFALGRPDPDSSELLTLVAVFAPVPAMLWAQLASLWRPDEQLGIIMAALYRTITVPPVVAVLCFAPTLLIGLLPPVWRGFVDHHRVTLGAHGLLPSGTPLPGWVGMAALVALGAGMLAGLFVAVFVVIPLIAFLRPQLMIGENELSTDPAHRRRNITSVRALSLLLMMIFVFAVLITDAAPGEVRFTGAMISLAVLVLLTVVVWRTQRVDPARRAVSGTQALVRGPDGPDVPDGQGVPRGPEAADPDPSGAAGREGSAGSSGSSG